MQQRHEVRGAVDIASVSGATHIGVRSAARQALRLVAISGTHSVGRCCAPPPQQRYLGALRTERRGQRVDHALIRMQRAAIVIGFHACKLLIARRDCSSGGTQFHEPAALQL